MKNARLMIRQIAGGIFICLLAALCTPAKKTATAIIQPAPVYPEFLLLSDIHFNSGLAVTGKHTDTGTDLWAVLLEKLNTILGSKNPPRFILCTGDLPAHYSCVQGCYLSPVQRQQHNKNIMVVLDSLRAISSRYRVPFFFVPGNNDALAGNYYSFADEQHQTIFNLVPANGNQYPALNIAGGSSLAPCMVSIPDTSMGYYAARPVTGLRLICLNTVMYSKKFKVADGSDAVKDGEQQLQWLAAQLNEAAQLGEKVYIAMHIPPGSDAYGKSGMWTSSVSGLNPQNELLNLCNSYEHTIKAIFFGHTHMDEMRRLFDSSGNRMTTIAVSCPGITPLHGNNPAFKMINYDERSKELMNFTTSYTHIGNSTWGDSSYSFNTVFSNPPGKTIADRLREMSAGGLADTLRLVYTTKNSPVKYEIQQAIDVKQQ